MKNKPIELVLIGDSQVGKTSIINIISGIGFDESLTRTVGVDFCYINLKLDDGTKTKIKVFDTSGQEQYHAISLNVLRQSDGIILVFSKDSIDSFKNIKDIWIEKINQSINMEDFSLILVENKIDLEDSVINEKDILDLKNEYKLDFIEVSAKMNKNIERLFKTITMKVLEKKNKDKKNKNKKNNDTKNKLPSEPDNTNNKKFKITKDKNKTEEKNKKNYC